MPHLTPSRYDMTTIRIRPGLHRVGRASFSNLSVLSTICEHDTVRGTAVSWLGDVDDAFTNCRSAEEAWCVALQPPGAVPMSFQVCTCLQEQADQPSFRCTLCQVVLCLQCDLKRHLQPNTYAHVRLRCRRSSLSTSDDDQT